MLPWELWKCHFLPVSQNLSSVYLSPAKFQLVSSHLSLAMTWQMTYSQLPKLCSATLNPIEKSLQLLLSWITLILLHMSTAFQEKALVTIRYPFNLIPFHYLLFRINQKLYNAKKNKQTILYLCFFLLIEGALSISLFILISWYEKCLHICYSNKPSFLSSWTSVQSTAKVNTYSVNQCIDCECTM